MASYWYVLRVQSGKEEEVRARLDKKVQVDEVMSRLILNIMVPTETIYEMKGGQRKTRKKKMYPGYLLVEMEMTDKAWHFIRDTSGVGDFISSGSKPVPMPQDEIDRVLEIVHRGTEEAPALKIDFEVGDKVKIKEGPFENFEGSVGEVNAEKGRVKVVVTIFGRPTPVDLEYWQIDNI